MVTVALRSKNRRTSYLYQHSRNMRYGASVHAVPHWLLVSVHLSSDSEAHINHATNAISTLDMDSRLITRVDAISVDTHMHVVEAIVDCRESALVSNVLIDFDLTVQIICENCVRVQGRVSNAWLTFD